MERLSLIGLLRRLASGGRVQTTKERVEVEHLAATMEARVGVQEVVCPQCQLSNMKSKKTKGASI